MKVMFIMPHPIEGPSSRFRVYQYIDTLREQQIEVILRPFISSRHALALYRNGSLLKKMGLMLWATLGRLGDLWRALRCDVVYILREAYPFGPPFFEKAFASLSHAMVYDFDDAIWLASSVHHNPLDRLRDWQKPAKVVRAASHVVVGCENLADYARQHIRQPDAITVIPTVVDSNRYCPISLNALRSVPKAEAKTITIGWIGTPRGSQAFLMPFLPTMRTFSVRYPHVRWRFVGAESFPCESLPVEFKTWQLDEEISDIQSFDIGLMPLVDDEYTRGKCGFKLIQYMNCGIPVVCSPVGANKEIVRQGVNGFFANSPAEWEAALVHLIEASPMRQQMGQAGRDLAIQQFSLAAQAPRLLNVIQQVGPADASKRAIHHI